MIPPSRVAPSQSCLVLASGGQAGMLVPSSPVLLFRIDNPSEDSMEHTPFLLILIWLGVAVPIALWGFWLTDD